MATEANSSNYATAGATFAGLLSGAGNYLTATHPYFAFTLVGLSLLMLAIVGYQQINSNRAVKGMSVAVGAATLLMYVLFGYQELHRPAPVPMTTRTTSSGPTVSGTSASEGDNAPAVVGTGNSVSYGAPASASAPKHAARRNH